MYVYIYVYMYVCVYIDKLWMIVLKNTMSMCLLSENDNGSPGNHILRANTVCDVVCCISTVINAVFSQ